MKMLLASLVLICLCAIGCNEQQQPPSKPSGTSTSSAVKPVTPAPVKPQADKPPTDTPSNGKTDGDKKNNGAK